jgi:hypothetical protein
MYTTVLNFSIPNINNLKSLAVSSLNPLNSEQFHVRFTITYFTNSILITSQLLALWHMTEQLCNCQFPSFMESSVPNNICAM